MFKQDRVITHINGERWNFQKAFKIDSGKEAEI